MKRVRILPLVLAFVLCLTASPAAYAAGNGGYDSVRDCVTFAVGTDRVEVHSSRGTVTGPACDFSGAELLQLRSADGTAAAASVSNDEGSFLLWSDGSTVRELTAILSDCMFALPMNGSGVFFATESRKGTELCLSDGRTIRKLANPTGGVRSLNPSPDGVSLGYVDGNGVGWLWDKKATRIGSDLRAVIPASEQGLVYTLDDMGDVRVRRGPGGKDTLLTPDRPVESLLFNRDGSMVLLRTAEETLLSENGRSPVKVTADYENPSAAGSEAVLLQELFTPAGTVLGTCMAGETEAAFAGVASFRGCLFSAGETGSLYLDENLRAHPLPTGSFPVLPSRDGTEAMTALTSGEDETSAWLTLTRLLSDGADRTVLEGPVTFFAASDDLNITLFLTDWDDKEQDMWTLNRSAAALNFVDCGSYPLTPERSAFFGDSFYFVQDGELLRTDGTDSPKAVTALSEPVTVTVCGGILLLEGESTVLCSTDGQHFDSFTPFPQY